MMAEALLLLLFLLLLLQVLIFCLCEIYNALKHSNIFYGSVSQLGIQYNFVIYCGGYQNSYICSNIIL